MIRFASLGSGSQGNALVVESRGTRILLDCGFGPRELAVRLGRLGLSASDVHAVLVTHEHSDHIAGVFKLALRHTLPVYLTHGCLAAAPRGRQELPEIHVIDSHQSFTYGELQISPFPVPHDAREPVQFVFSDGAARLGVLTDTGHVTPHIQRMLSGCEALIVECNHDPAMLAAGPYPPFLKARVGGAYGHLDNESAAALLRAIDGGRLAHLIAAHLSEQNNTPSLARGALAAALGCAANWIGVATQAGGFGWRCI